jgi:hypothetical protein
MFALARRVTAVYDFPAGSGEELCAAWRQSRMSGY